MSNANLPASTLVAGIIQASCTCCATPTQLVNHVAMGATRMVCPATRRTYLDRGDGLFQADGQGLSAELMRAPPAVPARVDAPAPRTHDATAELLSDRPTRTAEKTRISLERATFA